LDYPPSAVLSAPVLRPADVENQRKIEHQNGVFRLQTGTERRYEVRVRSVLKNFIKRLGSRARYVVGTLSATTVSAIETEHARASRRAEQNEERTLLDQLPDPPHLEIGEVKYGEGMHDYF
jgi:predicted nuclease with RNAse H fold